MNKVTLPLPVLAFVASSMTLWLFESPLKAILYFFEAALILRMDHFLSGNFKKTMSETKRNGLTLENLVYSRLS